MINFSTDSFTVAVGPDGHIQRLIDRRDGSDYLAEGQAAPLLRLAMKDGVLAPTSATYEQAEGLLTLSYGDGSSTARIGVTSAPTHLDFELMGFEGATPESVHWGPIPATIGKRVGAVVGVVRDDSFAIGVQSLNVQTIGLAAPKPFGSVLQAYSKEHDGGVQGSKIALFGCPADRALDTIGQIELAEGLPHPVLDGVWGKQSPTARMPYLITWSFGEGGRDLDALLDVARQGGMQYIYHAGPFQTWGHFRLDPKQFPKGDESLGEYARRAEQRGIRLGVHTLSGFITTNDPYVTPIPDPRLGRWAATTLAGDVDASATEIPVTNPEAFARTGTLSTAIIGQELVQHQGVSGDEPWRLVGCGRGAFGTSATPHQAGADIGQLADHAYRTFYPGIENGMLDEMTARLVELFNTTGLRQISFDGLEGLSTYGYGQYARNRFVKQCYDGWTPEVISDASNLLHYLWHVHTRMNWGELTQSAKVDIDNYRAKNCAFFEDNLFPTALGWWRFSGAALDWEATRLEDVEYLLAKAAGFSATHGMQTHPSAIASHGYGQECLAMVKAWGQARLAKAFSQQQKARLREPGADWSLETVGEGQWALRQVKYSPFYWMCPGTGRKWGQAPPQATLSLNTADERHTDMDCEMLNPFEPQPLRFELRALGSFDYDGEENIDLTGFAPGDFRRSSGLVEPAPPVEVSQGKVGDCVGYGLRASNADKDAVSRSTRVVADFAEPLDLRKHRGLGLWVRGDGKGELLFIELISGGAVRQYYVPITFTGERYFEFPLAETCAGRYYAYAPWDGFAAWHVTLKGFNYTRVNRLAMGLHKIPGGADVSCAVAGIKALKELGAGLANPSVQVGDQTLFFADTLSPGDYLIYEGGRVGQVRDANFRLLREVKAQTEPVTPASGLSTATVAYEGVDGPAPWARLEFNCRGPVQRLAQEDA